MPPLVPCLECKRHVRIDHDVCPFCGATARDASARVIPGATRRLDRWAVFTFATAIASACSSGGLTSSEDGGATGDGGGSVKDGGGVQDDGGLQAIYGAPVDGGGFDSGNVQPPYGLPPQDAGSPKDGGSPAPLYGLPADSG